MKYCYWKSEAFFHLKLYIVDSVNSSFWVIGNLCANCKLINFSSSRMRAGMVNAKIEPIKVIIVVMNKSTKKADFL